ncbi:hypothetical protein DBB_47520 [Desulfoluna spongiiphila]|nr:hypothetical protein DBB_47520 [Desulfoluna spongiiphila]
MLVIYDDIYQWKGPEGGCKECAAGDTRHTPWLITCRLRIIDLAPGTTSVMPLKRHVVLAEDISDGPRRRICAESLGRHIFCEFNLSIKRTLWIECDPFLKEAFHAAHFTPAYHDGEETIYTITWRPLLHAEKNTLKTHLTTFSETT